MIGMSKTILIVEDEAAMLSILTDTCREAGFSVISARNGLEALSAFKESAPDLVILDIIMPKMSGLTFLSEIKAFNLAQKLPIILLTNFVDRAAIAEATKIHSPLYCLRKTDITLEGLVALINKIHPPMDGEVRPIF